jgi:hypothetical protein
MMLSRWNHLTNASFSLSVVDDAAREDFSPRQRHTLKEFAVCSDIVASTTTMSSIYDRPLPCEKWSSGVTR